MRYALHQNNELTQEVALLPVLATAISAWYAARYRFLLKPLRHNQDAYDAATNGLGLAFSRCKVEQPDLVEQLRFGLPRTLKIRRLKYRIFLFILKLVIDRPNISIRLHLNHVGRNIVRIAVLIRRWRNA